MKSSISFILNEGNEAVNKYEKIVNLFNADNLSNSAFDIANDEVIFNDIPIGVEDGYVYQIILERDNLKAIIYLHKGFIQIIFVDAHTFIKINLFKELWSCLNNYLYILIGYDIEIRLNQLKISMEKVIKDKSLFPLIMIDNLERNFLINKLYNDTEKSLRVIELEKVLSDFISLTK